MSPLVQQRLIGSILLLCALSVIVFLLIDSATPDVEVVAETQVELPFVSSIDVIDTDIQIVEAEQETLIDAQTSVDEVEVDVAEPSPVNQAATETIDNKPIIVATWVLQLASLADKKAATALSNKVGSLGYQATVEKAETTKGDRFRIRIGPNQDKAALEAIAKVLENKLKLKPLLLKHVL